MKTVILHAFLLLQNAFLVLKNQYLLGSGKSSYVGFCLFQVENLLIYVTEQV